MICFDRTSAPWCTLVNVENQPLKEHTMEDVTIQCPFCGEKDFDLVGLKVHLLRFCEKFENTEVTHHGCFSLIPDVEE